VCFSGVRCDAFVDLGISRPAVLGQLVQAGILVQAGNPAEGEQDYMFLHRAIAEYLAARCLRDLSAEHRMEAVARHLWFDPDWAGVFPLLGGLLAEDSRPGEARDLALFFLTQQPDPLHYAFRTGLRVLGEAPGTAKILGSDQEQALGGKTAALLTNPATRGMLAATLATLSALPAPVTGAVRTLLTDQDWYVRQAAAQGLKGRAGDMVTDSLLQLLNDQDESVCRDAAWGLSDRAGDKITNILLRLVNDHDEDVRQAAAQGLKGRAGDMVTGSLLQLLNDEHPEVRQAAVWGLSDRAGDEIAGSFLQLLKDEDRDVRQMAAASGLKARGDDEITGSLLKLLNDENRDVRVAAAEGLADRGGDDEITGSLLQLLNDQDDKVRQAAAAGLHRRDDAAILLQVARTTAWSGQPAKMLEYFQLASTIADRTYLRVAPSDREQVRIQLDDLTRKVANRNRLPAIVLPQRGHRPRRGHRCPVLHARDQEPAGRRHRPARRHPSRLLRGRRGDRRRGRFHPEPGPSRLGGRIARGQAGTGRRIMV
jgi:HEAT repeat protein